MVILVQRLSRCRFTCAPTPRKGDQVFIIHPYSNPCLLRIGINLHDLTKENIIQIKNVRDSQDTSTDKNFKDFLNVQ